MYVWGARSRSRFLGDSNNNKAAVTKKCLHFAEVEQTATCDCHRILGFSLYRTSSRGPIAYYEIALSSHSPYR